MQVTDLPDALCNGLMEGPWDELDDIDLLRRAREDPESFGVFYDRHAAAVLAFCVRRTACAETAADITAEVFARPMRIAACFAMSARRRRRPPMATERRLASHCPEVGPRSRPQRWSVRARLGGYRLG